ncbi:MAG: hypothetical protein WCG85_14380 [Polyangia bacterium]
MGIFSMFRKQDTREAVPSKYGPISVARIFVEQLKQELTTQRCQVPKCGITFLSGASIIGLNSVSPLEQHFTLDVGGFCSECNRYVCHRHAMISLEKEEQVSPTQKIYQGRIACRECQSKLWPSEAEYKEALRKHEETMKCRSCEPRPGKRTVKTITGMEVDEEWANETKAVIDRLLGSKKG